MQEEKFYKKKNFYTLKVTEEHQNLDCVAKCFLDDIEKEFKKFNKEYEKNYEELNKYLNNESFCFFPEKLVKKSPLTILNAPWGTGKTFFIEAFTKFFIDKKLKSEVFKKIIILDAWKFSNSNNVPYDFAYEISQRIVGMLKINIDIKEKLKDFLFKKITPSFGFNFGFISASFTVEKLTDKQNELNNKIEEEFKKIKNNITPTIIFVDNLERLGKYSWDLLKCIIKIQEFSNFLIVLPMNINKLSNNNKNDFNEYPIDKYIDFHYYNFEQDYFNFLQKIIKNNSLLQELNKIFNTEIDGEKLSIRDLEKSIKEHNIFDKKDKYEILEIIQKFVWSETNEIRKIIKEDLKTYIKYHKTLFSLYKEIADNLSLKGSSWNTGFINFSNEFENSVIPIDRNKNRYLYYFDTNYVSEFYKINDELNKTKENYYQKLDKINDEIKQIENKLNELNIQINNINNQIEKDNNKLEVFENQKNSGDTQYDAEKHTKLESTLSKKSSYKNSLTTKLSNFEKNLEKTKQNLSIINTDLQSMFTNLPDYIKNYEELVNSIDLSKNEIDRINKFLQENYISSNLNFEDLLDIDFDQDDKTDLFFK